MTNQLLLSFDPTLVDSCCYLYGLSKNKEKYAHRIHKMLLTEPCSKVCFLRAQESLSQVAAISSVSNQIFIYDVEKHCQSVNPFNKNKFKTTLVHKSKNLYCGSDDGFVVEFDLRVQKRVQLISCLQSRDRICQELKSLHLRNEKDLFVMYSSGEMKLFDIRKLVRKGFGSKKEVEELASGNLKHIFKNKFSDVCSVFFDENVNFVLRNGTVGSIFQKNESFVFLRKYKFIASTKLRSHTISWNSKNKSVIFSVEPRLLTEVKYQNYDTSMCHLESLGEVQALAVSSADGCVAYSTGDEKLRILSI
eukprot:snap_masked-scaffold_50-processed-gene-1.32-mRNA-1 protein AED:1.00 eAED:1.00 QI:0/-1/0/0/-1/1/1/0/305